MPIDNYLVLYYPFETRSTVSIMRVMYCGRDVETQLKLIDEE